jgi:hypothetical protein
LAGASQVKVTVPLRATAPPSGSTSSWTSRGTGSGSGKGWRLIIIPGSGSGGHGLACASPRSILPECVHLNLGSSLLQCLPLTLGWMGAVFKVRYRGRPGLKLQEKVGRAASPWARVTISSDWSVKSPVSGCLLVSSFTDTPVVRERQDKIRRWVWEQDQEEAAGGGWGRGGQCTMRLTFSIRNQGFPIQVPAKRPCGVASLRRTCPHLRKE